MAAFLPIDRAGRNIRADVFYLISENYVCFFESDVVELQYFYDDDIVFYVVDFDRMCVAKLLLVVIVYFVGEGFKFTGASVLCFRITRCSRYVDVVDCTISCLEKSF